MDRTYAAIALTLAICVLAIPAAYLMGQRSALEIAQRQYQDELARQRTAHVKAAAERSEPKPQSAHAQIARANPESAESTVVDAERLAQRVPVSEPAPADAHEPARADEPAPPPIPQSAFDAAAIGTTYEQVVREFGREGESMMTLEDGDGSVTTQYAWDWLDAEGNTARIRVQFVDGHLIDKSISD